MDDELEQTVANWEHNPQFRLKDWGKAEEPQLG
jgi:hypothetical protein